MLESWFDQILRPGWREQVAAAPVSSPPHDAAEARPASRVHSMVRSRFNRSAITKWLALSEPPTTPQQRPCNGRVWGELKLAQTPDSVLVTPWKPYSIKVSMQVPVSWSRYCTVSHDLITQSACCSGTTSYGQGDNACPCLRELLGSLNTFTHSATSAMSDDDRPPVGPGSPLSLLQLGSDPIENVLRLLSGDLGAVAASCRALLHAVLRSGRVSLRLDASKADLAW